MSAPSRSISCTSSHVHRKKLICSIHLQLPWRNYSAPAYLIDNISSHSYLAKHASPCPCSTYRKLTSNHVLPWSISSVPQPATLRYRPPPYNSASLSSQNILRGKLSCFVKHYPSNDHLNSDPVPTLRYRKKIQTPYHHAPPQYSTPPITHISPFL